MRTSSKKNRNNGVTLVKNMRDYSHDAAIKRSAKEAIQFLKKAGIPGWFVRGLQANDSFKKDS